MPRTSVVESPGCPPIRALAFDVLGLIKGNSNHYHNNSYITPTLVDI